jgi:hypothetical protein
MNQIKRPAPNRTAQISSAPQGVPCDGRAVRLIFTTPNSITMVATMRSKYGIAINFLDGHWRSGRWEEGSATELDSLSFSRDELPVTILRFRKVPHPRYRCPCLIEFSGERGSLAAVPSGLEP